MLQSPYGAFCLRPVYWEATMGSPVTLQSPYGAFCLQQHTPLNTVLYRGAGGGIYEKLELSTAPLWITGVKSAFFAMRAYFSTLLDFLWRGFAFFIAKPGFQSALSNCSTGAL